jgi:hypothetical protein
MHDEMLGSLMVEFYAAISGPAGPRDAERERSVFHSAARLMRTGVDGTGRPWIKIMTVDEYLEDTRAFFAANDLYEVEIAQRVDSFGNVAHVRSVYEKRWRLASSNDPEQIGRGVNSVQLYHDGARWWVISVLWDNERAGVDLPREWLAKEGSSAG